MTEQALSAAQRRLWFAYQLDPASAEFTVAWAARLRGPAQPDRLTAAWRSVLNRHSELRLRLTEVGGEPRRGHWAAEDFTVPVRDVTPAALPVELSAAVERVFDLVGDRLVELVLLRTAPDEHVLVLSAHHAVLDGRSLTIVVDDLFSAYDGRPPGEPGRPYQEYVDGEAATVPAADRIDAWAEELRLPDVTDPLGHAPADPAAGTPADRAAATVRQPLAAGTWRAVRDLGRQHRTTPQVVGLAAFAAVLARHTGSDDLLIGGTMDTRSAAFVDTVGMFVNPVPVRVHVDPDEPVSGYLRSVHRSLLRSYAHRTVPFEQLARRMRADHDVSRTPVFQVLFNYEPPESSASASGLRGESIETPVHVALYDLMLVLRDHGPSAELVAVYPRHRYTEEQITQLVRHVGSVLAQMVAEDRPVGGLEPLSDADRERQLAAGRGADPEGDLRPVHEIIREIAGNQPDSPAVVFRGVTLTYAEVDRRSAGLAAALAARGVGPRTPVGVLLDPSADAVVAALAVLRAGGTYVPLHPEHPPARTGALLADSGAKFVITDRAPMDGVEAIGPRCTAPSSTALPDVGPGDPAYIVYTSGTTGEPKGVVVEHASLSASTAARRAVYPGHHTFLLLSPFSFDSSMAGLWGTLTGGGCLVVADTDEVRDPRRILELVAGHGVSTMLTVPALYARVLDAAERTGAGRPGSLRTVITAGEALPEALVERHFRHRGPTELVNEYGPTEATVWSTYRRFTGPAPVDVGGPAPGTRLYVLDPHGRLVPWGAAGELYVGGSGVARGYLGRSEATDAAFVPDPFAADGSRMYRTGDWVRWNAAGGLSFIGRRDELVKVRGHRVELGAVESALRACPEVTDAAVLLAPKGDSLAAFLVTDAGYDADVVLARLAETLPPPAVPATLRTVPSLPRTPHGKVDRDALSALDRTEPPAAPAAHGNAPADGSGVRAAVHAAWCEVLEVPAVAHDVNFFDAGGHSLLVPLLQAEIEDRLGVELAIVDLFGRTTVEAQAALVSGELAAPADAPADPPADPPVAVDPRRARLAAASRARRTRSEVAR